jgi:shikimate kinase
LKEILAINNNFILSLGGGTPCYANNMIEVNQGDAISVYLKGSVPTIVKRLLKEKQKRPLIASLEADQIPEFVAKHLFERGFFYEQAKMSVKIDGKTKSEISKELEKILN